MKLVLKIFNLVYLVLAAVAITSFCTKPYIEINGGYKVQGEQIAEFLPPEIETYLNKDEIKEIIDEKEVKVNLNISVPAKIVFNFKDKEATTNTINEMIENTVSGTMNELKPVIHDLAEAIAKKVANSLIYQAIEKYADQYKNPTISDTGLALEQAGIDAVYIETFTEEVFETLQSGDATIDSVMVIVDSKMVDVVAKLEAAEVIPAGSGLELGSDTSAQIREEMTESFKSMGICDEDGNITDIDKAMENLLAGLIDSLIQEGETEQKEEGGEVPEQKPAEEKPAEEPPTEEPGKKHTVYRGEPAGEDVEEAEDELTIKIRQLIDKYIADIDIPGYVTEYGLYIFIATLFLMLPWAILAVVSIIRIIRPKKCWVKTWYVFVFAFEQLLLGVVITIATAKFLPQIANIIPLGDLKEVLNSLSLTVKTSSFIPSVLYLAMIPFTLIYMILAHKVKKQYKEEKREKKAAKKAA